jgi:hypothetical protein
MAKDFSAQSLNYGKNSLLKLGQFTRICYLSFLINYISLANFHCVAIPMDS